jgi:type VI secretion system FHA domain protein
MTLTLNVLRCPPAVVPEMRQVASGDFSIGRGPDVDWMLPDPDRQISKRHCVIALRNGTWRVAGISTNGTFLNRDEEPLESRAPQPLAHGDRLRLGPYEIEVSLTEEAAMRPRAAGFGNPQRAPIRNPFEDDPFASQPPFAAEPLMGGEPVLNRSSAVLPPDFNPLLPEEEIEPFAGPTMPDHQPAVSDAISLPSVRAVLPDNWDLDEPAPVKPAPMQSAPGQPALGQPALGQPALGQPALARPALAQPAFMQSALAQPAFMQSALAQPAPGQPLGQPALGQPVPTRPAPGQPGPVEAKGVPAPPPPQPAAASAPQIPFPAPAADLLAAFLRGAGMEDAHLPDPVHTMEQLGSAFRALVSGIRDALIARAGAKREFRIEATQIRTHGNNLLKFSANDDDALAGLLGTGRRSDMTPPEAVADALADMRQHELAVMAAMQAAVRALVTRLGPDQVQKAAGAQSGGLALLVNRRARAWEAYEALHAEVLRGLSDDFDSVFGKHFARAYEAAIRDLSVRQKHRP